MIIGDRIRQRREKLGLRQIDIARKVGVSREAVSQWESSDSKNLKIENLYRCAVALGVSMEWLAVGGSSDPIAEDVKSQSHDLDLPAVDFALSTIRAHVDWAKRRASGVDAEVNLFALLYRYWLISKLDGGQPEPASPEVGALVKMEEARTDNEPRKSENIMRNSRGDRKL